MRINTLVYEIENARLQINCTVIYKEIDNRVDDMNGIGGQRFLLGSKVICYIFSAINVF